MSGKVNTYLTKALGLQPVDKICTSVVNRNKKTKNAPKVQLSLLRELCVYISANVEIEEQFSTGMVEQLSDLADQDADRKILRTCAYIVVEILSRESINSDQHKVIEMINYFTKEVNKGASAPNSRQFLAFSVLGFLSAYNQRHQINLSTDDTLYKLLTSSLKELKHVGKQRKSMFGSDKEYVMKCLHWNAVMKALASVVARPISKECYGNLFYGVLSSYAPLARNSMRVLMNTATHLNEDQSILELSSLLLDRKKKGKEYINLDDDLSASYFIRTVLALANNVDWFAAPLTEGSERVLDLFVCVMDLLKNTR